MKETEIIQPLWHHLMNFTIKFRELHVSSTWTLSKQIKSIWGCLYHLSVISHLISHRNDVFHFPKRIYIRMNSFHPGEISSQRRWRSHRGEMICLHVNSFCRAVSPRQDCSFRSDLVCFYIYCMKKRNSPYNV